MRAQKELRRIHTNCQTVTAVFFISLTETEASSATAGESPKNVYPEKSHVGMGRTRKRHTGRPEQECKPAPLHCEADELTSGPPCDPFEDKRFVK